MSSERDLGETTWDFISDRLAIRQRVCGYRFGLDALLLATDLPEIDASRPLSGLVDLGAGQGAVGLSVASRRVTKRVLLVERNRTMLELLAGNVERNAELFDAVKVSVAPCDLRQVREEFKPHQVQLALCNPPYFPRGHRRQSEDEERADAHHERHGDLLDFMRAAAYLLDHRGWLKMIAPPWRLGEIGAERVSDLKCLSLRFVHDSAAAPAYLVEVVMRRGGGPDLIVRAPLIVRDEQGYYTPEVARRVAGAALPEAPTAAQIERTRAASRARRRSKEAR